MKGISKKGILLFLIIIIIATIHLSGVVEIISLENLKVYGDKLKLFVQNNFAYASIIYILSYILLVAFSVPVASIMSLAGGYLFGFFYGLIYVNLSATIGALIMYLISKYFLGEYIQNKYAEKIKTINEEIKKDGYLYLITLRLIPIFPFFLVNLIASFTHVKTWTFVWTTSVGIFPASILFVLAGKSIEQVNSVGDIFSLEVASLFMLLGLFVQLPNIVKRLKRV
ncbi:MAG: TVP38/TMEM64 family protein [Calditerrivibrio sp.]|nr:TVP38/TMEM64 family protein [Calditerrivibrio sp.]